MGAVLRLDDKNIWRMINAALIVCIGLSCGKDLLGISKAGFGTILTAVIMILIVMLMDRVSTRGRLLCMAVVCAVLAAVGAAVGFRGCMEFFRSYFCWLFGLPGWQSEWSAGYEMMQTVVLVPAGYLIERIMEKNFRIKLAGTIALIAGLLYALFAEKEVPKQGVALIICYIILSYVEWTQIRWKKERGRSIQAYMVWIVPFIAVYFVFMMFCAAPDEPYDWKMVRNVYQHLAESFKKVSQNILRGGSEDYDLNLSGFSDRGNIGNDTLEDDREIMKIWDESGLVTNVYLSGKVYDTFDGRQWMQLNEDTSKERYMDTLETMYAVRRYDNKYFTDYMKYADFKINYQYFRSEYLFAPLKPLNFVYNGKSLDFGEVGGSLFFNKAKGYGTEYEVSFYQLNAGQAGFDRFLSGAGALPPDGEILARLLKELEKRTGVIVSTDDMAHYRQAVYEHYTGQAELSDEVREYLENITANAGTDAEKLRAIEAELSTYDYTLMPGELPDTVMDGGDFLDYFLLQSKAGYCSHFATAFALLARAEGIPARYVQGFCVPLEGNEETVVYSDMAHAWPEVYLDGIGWIPYEPTPGYSEVRYTPWALQSGYEYPAEEENDWRTGRAEPEETKDQPAHNGSISEPAGYTVGNSIRQFMGMAAVALLFIGGAGIAICILNRLIADYRYRKMSAEEKLRAEIRQSLQILSLMGIKRQDETLEEFRKRVEDTSLDKGSLRFLERYEEIIYGSREADKEVIDMAKKQQKELLLLLKKKRRWAYIYCRFWTRSR